MHNFKVGDTVKCKTGQSCGPDLIFGNHYKVTRTSQNYLYFGNDAWDYNRFELVESNESFIIREWNDWVDDIIKRTSEQLKGLLNNGFDEDVSVDSLIHGPKLDPENPREFCGYYMFSNIYENNVFVKHHKEPNCYWYISSDTTSLIYKPKKL